MAWLTQAEYDYLTDLLTGRYDKPAPRRRRVIEKFRIEGIALEPSGFRTEIQVLEARYV